MSLKGDLEEIEGSQRTEVHLFLDHRTDSSNTSGCAINEFSFTNVICPNIDVITFCNYYTAFLSIKARLKTKTKEGSGKWRTILHGYQLMPQPSTDLAAQSKFTLTQTDFRHPLEDIITLRFIMQQPCSMWRDFHLDEVNFLRYKSVGPGYSLAAAASGVQDKEDPKKVQVAARLRELWALNAYHDALAVTETSVGNYEKDGVYEGSLLAYS